MLEFFSQYQALVIVLVQALFAWAVWSLSKKFTSQKACHEQREAQQKDCAACRLQIDSRLDAVEQRGLELNASLSNLPTVQDFHVLAQSLEKLNGSLGREIEGLRGGQRAMEEGVKSLGHSIDAVKHQVGLLMEHGLNGGNNGRP